MVSCLKEKCPLYGLGGTCGIVGFSPSKRGRPRSEERLLNDCADKWEPAIPYKERVEMDIISLVKAYTEEGLSRSDIAKNLGVHPDSVRRYQKRL